MSVTVEVVPDEKEKAGAAKYDIQEECRHQSNCPSVILLPQPSLPLPLPLLLLHLILISFCDLSFFAFTGKNKWLFFENPISEDLYFFCTDHLLKIIRFEAVQMFSFFTVLSVFWSHSLSLVLSSALPSFSLSLSLSLCQLLSAYFSHCSFSL